MNLAIAADAVVEISVVLESEIDLAGICEMTPIRQRFLSYLLQEIGGQTPTFAIFRRWRIYEFNLTPDNVMKPNEKHEVNLFNLLGLKLLIRLQSLLKVAILKYLFPWLRRLLFRFLLLQFLSLHKIVERPMLQTSRRERLLDCGQRRRIFVLLIHLLQDHDELVQVIFICLVFNLLVIMIILLHVRINCPVRLGSVFLDVVHPRVHGGHRLLQPIAQTEGLVLFRLLLRSNDLVAELREVAGQDAGLGRWLLLDILVGQLALRYGVDLIEILPRRRILVHFYSDRV